MTETDWLDQIRHNYKDVATQLAFSDWLRDRGEDRLANAWEWMARCSRWCTGRTWRNAASYGDLFPDTLPEAVFRALPCESVEEATGHYVVFYTLSDAAAALAAALVVAEVLIDETC